MRLSRSRWTPLLLGALGVGACGPSAPTFHDGLNAPAANRSSLDEGPFLPLDTRDGRIVDAAGRQVLLRGVEHHALQDVVYVGREVVPADYPLIASWGFTTVRMAISWSRLEPSRGQYDDGYVAEIRAAMDACRAARLGVVLEWHQDLWGKCALDTNTANGAPDWTCPTPPPAVGALFDRLWQNQDGLFDAFLAGWGHVLDALGNHPALAGLDVFNEPAGTAQSPALERDVVYPAYARRGQRHGAARALRARASSRLGQVPGRHGPGGVALRRARGARARARGLRRAGQVRGDARAVQVGRPLPRRVTF